MSDTADTAKEITPFQTFANGVPVDADFRPKILAPSESELEALAERNEQPEVRDPEQHPDPAPVVVVPDDPTENPTTTDATKSGKPKAPAKA